MVDVQVNARRRDGTSAIVHGNFDRVPSIEAHATAVHKRIERRVQGSHSAAEAQILLLREKIRRDASSGHHAQRSGSIRVVAQANRRAERLDGYGD